MKIPKPFKLGTKGLSEVQSRIKPQDGLYRVPLLAPPGQPARLGYARPNGTGLGLENPSHLEMLALRTSMIRGTDFARTLEDLSEPGRSGEPGYGWGI
jgi:hypothetical protein